MTLRTQLAYAAAGLVLILGLLGLLNPGLTARILGLDIVASRGLAEIRSVQGALFLTIAGFLLWAIPLRPRTGPLLRTIGILLAGAAVGRLASLVIDGGLGLGNLLLLLGQGFVAGAAVWASYESKAAMRAEAERRAAERRAAEARERTAARPATPDVSVPRGVPGRSETPVRDQAPTRADMAPRQRPDERRGAERR